VTPEFSAQAPPQSLNFKLPVTYRQPKSDDRPARDHLLKAIPTTRKTGFIRTQNTSLVVLWQQQSS
jgi:hypothetical protein